MEILRRVVGPLATNLYLVADPRTREAIAIDTAIPSLDLVTADLAARGWRLLLIVSTHGHWDHMGDDAAVSAHTGAPIAVHPDDREMLVRPQPLFAPFEIPPCVPAVDLAEGGRIRIGSVDLEVLHTPGHTPGSVCLLSRETGTLFAGDTLFPGGWGRVDLPGGDPEAMVGSLGRLERLDDAVRVLPGHGADTTIGRERSWLELVRREGRLLA
ncbi:MAG: MBL fold metallo-hydrolase [Chloroflexi bacterium]|nr:MBL fold metallo-hydrolase [Chloroflexota bacterium]